MRRIKYSKDGEPILLEILDAKEFRRRLTRFISKWRQILLSMSNEAK